MTHEEAVRQMTELNVTIGQHAAAASRAAQAYDAHMALFNVAAQTEDGPEMEKERVATLQAVETILDSGAMIYKLKNQIDKIAREAPPPNNWR